MKLKNMAILGLSAGLFLLSGCRDNNEQLEESAAAQTASLSKFEPSNLPPAPPEIREEFAQDGIDIDRVRVEYFSDGQPVDMIDDLENKFPVASLVKNPADQSALITVRTFSNEEKYLQYGDQNGLKFRETKAFNESIQKYAEINGLVQMAEAGEQLPDTYYAFENQQYQTYFGALSPGWLRVYDDIIPYGSNKYVMSPVVPTLGFWFFDNWNNKIGCYKRQHIYMVEHLYDKKFFKKHLVSLAGWGSSTVMFWGILGYVNNKVESMILF
ncbi:hypothetical protein B0A69_10720 [Chryseobacterium shigense]|uniref:Uncharacterized protein n=1 Tax=Chryseobacterium shigense TaxID=297244 RepID=A0A1N7HXB0_9FLAO|nr:hypothetical protein [Chryseobacterium shigense]PQA94051.1 hypothetical protein B0A69_10720 [Chryseobacterium shigense]SIS29456.1 hypothetical protein SAMN05421639_101485 [Chryseobacterium shigense]